ncbi:putative uncharacterized protein DDB_G0292292 [Oppia nitens]|uniref:putative uncharacterized protein DDB_G0292292 n=1 Tax=Oppia nitens TaxID=1686743 RepID=UPI0023DB23E1|nr:putative uncharacterized protein DDB_G0292292 [Oppia nitens]
MTDPSNWRSHYSRLLKCWSLIKTSDLIKEKAYEELKSFTADQKAINRLKLLQNKNELNPIYEQTINLWHKSINENAKIGNYQAAAECLESLADISLKYGSRNEKRESLSSLIKASDYYTKASQPKQAVLALKRALNIIELSPKNDLTVVADKYRDCVQLYRELDLNNLADISQQICQSVDKQHDNNYSNFPMSADLMRSWSPSTTTYTVTTNNSDDDNDMDNSNGQTLGEQIENKEWVQKQIRLLQEECDQLNKLSSNYDNNTNSCNDLIDNYLFSTMTTNTTTANGIEDYDYYNKSTMNINEKTIDNQKNFTDNNNYNNNNEKKQKLRKNVKQLLKKFKSSPTDNRIDDNILPQTSESSPVGVEKTTTTTATVKKRKRRLKPKELSEESPEKRLIKLSKLQITHHFRIDDKHPAERLVCQLCEESILCYRWSIVTDHLKGRKHNQLVDKQLIVSTNSLSAGAIDNVQPVMQLNDTYGQTVNVTQLRHTRSTVSQPMTTTQIIPVPNTIMSETIQTTTGHVLCQLSPIQSLDSYLSLPLSTGKLVNDYDSQALLVYPCDDIDADDEVNGHQKTYKSLDTPPLMDMAYAPSYQRL